MAGGIGAEEDMGADMGGASLCVEAPVATILLDRAGALNAMLYRTWRALPGLIAAAGRDERVAVILLRGAGGHFGAGNDIAEFGRLRGDADGARRLGQAMADAMLAIERASKPVVVAIEGYCYGASVALALAGDMRVAADNARFAITPARLGAVYLRSDLHRLVAAVGQGQARRMLYTAQAIDAGEAEAISLVDHVVPLDRFEAELDRIARAMASGSPFTLHHSKRMLRTVGGGETPPETEETLGWFADAIVGEDFAEGVDAFLARRAPRFRRRAMDGQGR